MPVQDSQGITEPVRLIPAPSDPRREYGARQKLALEYLKLFVSLGLVGTVIFAGLQWRDANKVADQAVYQRVASEWKEHLTLFLEKPHLRPYFVEKKALIEDDPLRNAVLAAADLRLHVLDTIQTYYGTHWNDSEPFPQWVATVRESFRKAPVLCAKFFAARKNAWDEDLAKLAQESCEPDTASPPQSK
jgi:hypothetical protein